MYKNLIAEMARESITIIMIANMLKKSPETISRKIHVKSDFTMFEMQKIKKEFFPNLSIDYLFEN